MSDVADLAARRALKVERGLPARDPDFEVSGWLLDGKVDWSWMRWNVTDPKSMQFDQADRINALIDAAWMNARQGPKPDGESAMPAIWVRLSASGFLVMNWNKDLYTGTNWRHGWWLIRMWWWVTKFWIPLAWRATRGRG